MLIFQVVQREMLSNWLFLHLFEELNEIPFQHFVQSLLLHVWFQLQQCQVQQNVFAQLARFRPGLIDCHVLLVLFGPQQLLWLTVQLQLMPHEHFDLLTPSVQQVQPYAHLTHLIAQYIFRDFRALPQIEFLVRLSQNEVFLHCE